MIASEPQNTIYQTIFKKEYENYLDARNVLNPLAPLFFFGGGINGLLYRIPYIQQPQGLIKTCVLKCGGNRTVDNLLYEFLVGAYAINNLIENHNLTCFIRTYGLFKFKSVQDHQQMIVDVQAAVVAARAAAALAGTPFVPPLTPSATQLFRALSLQRLANRNMGSLIQEEMLRYPCDNNALYACMIENIPQVSISFQTYLGSPETGTKYINLIGIFSQIFMQLALIRNSFTHHDLHGENIMLYDGNPRCFQFTGVNVGVPYTFKCRYLVKLIDYGRSSFDVPQVAGPNITSADIIGFLNNAAQQINPPIPAGGGNRLLNCGVGMIDLIRNNEPCPVAEDIRNCRGPNLFSDSLMYIIASSNFGGFTAIQKNTLANNIQNQLTNARYPLNNGVVPAPGGVAQNTFIDIFDIAFLVNQNPAMIVLRNGANPPIYGGMTANPALATQLRVTELAMRFYNIINDNRYTRLSDWVFQNVPTNGMRWQ